jgi:hypothetical protein
MHVVSYVFSMTRILSEGSSPAAGLRQPGCVGLESCSRATFEHMFKSLPVAVPDQVKSEARGARGGELDGALSIGFGAAGHFHWEIPAQI